MVNVNVVHVCHKQSVKPPISIVSNIVVVGAADNCRGIPVTNHVRLIIAIDDEPVVHCEAKCRKQPRQRLALVESETPTENSVETADDFLNAILLLRIEVRDGREVGVLQVTLVRTTV